MHMRRSAARLVAVLVLAAGVSSCGGDKKYSNAYEGKKPPALVPVESTWLNVSGAPTLDTFRGKVVFLEFGFLR